MTMKTFVITVFCCFFSKTLADTDSSVNINRITCNDIMVQLNRFLGQFETKIMNDLQKRFEDLERKMERTRQECSLGYMYNEHESATNQTKEQIYNIATTVGSLQQNVGVVQSDVNEIKSVILSKYCYH